MSGMCGALELGLTHCPSCGLVCRLSAPTPAPLHCPRCHAALHPRKPESFARSWAFLIAAAVLYIPANLLPIMRTSTLLELHNDTIISGVVTLWRSGSPDLAVVVFVASIVVPMMKIAVLALLLVTAQRRSHWRRPERARLYRMIELVGHWSMLDIYVVALLAALVQFQMLARIEPGPGAVAFGAVVVLTMLASMSFDPRLIWDESPASSRQPHEPER